MTNAKKSSNLKTTLAAIALLIGLGAILFGYNYYINHLAQPDGLQTQYLAQKGREAPVVGVLTFYKYTGSKDSKYGSAPTYTNYHLHFLDFATGKLKEKIKLGSYSGYSNHFLWGKTEGAETMEAIDPATGKAVFPIKKLAEIWPDAAGWYDFKYTLDEFIFKMPDGREIIHKEADLAKLAQSQFRRSDMGDMQVTDAGQNPVRIVVTAWRKDKYITTKKDYLQPNVILGNDTCFLMKVRDRLDSQDRRYVWINAKGEEVWSWEAYKVINQKLTANWNLQPNDETILVGYNTKAMFVRRLNMGKQQILWTTEL